MSKTDDMRKQRESSQPKRVRVPLPPPEALDSIVGDELSFSGSPLTAEERATIEDRYPVGPTKPPGNLLASNYRPPNVTVQPDHVTKSVTRKGRPPYPEGTARTRYVGILATPAEVEAWKGQAGGSLSAWVRLTLNAACEALKVKP